MSLRCPLLFALCAALVSMPGAAVAEQPMDRFERLMEQGKTADVVTQARKWLERNIVDDRREAVVLLLHEASYAEVLATPSVAAAQAYQARYPKSVRVEDAALLEANLSLYEAAGFGTEAAYLGVAAQYVGTPAAEEAWSRATEAAFASASGAGTSDSWGRFLSDYRDSPREEEAQGLYRGALWADAEAAGTVAGWLDLRSSVPDHPRAAEALGREAELALAGLAEDAAFHAVNKLARRYIQTASGLEAVRRGAAHVQAKLFGSSFGVEHEVGRTVPAADEADEVPSLSTNIQRIEGIWPGPAPQGVRVTGVLWHQEALDEGARPWSDVALERLQEWGIPVLGTSPAPACRQTEAEVFGVRLTVWVGEQEVAERDLVVDVTRPCAGPLPFALALAEDGTLVGFTRPTSGGTGAVHVVPAVGGLGWVCAAPVRAERTGIWASCFGRELAIDGLPNRALIRAAVPETTGVPLVLVDDAGQATLPVAPAGAVWHRPVLPPWYAFGPGPHCAIPKATDIGDPLEAAETSSEPTLPSAPRPDWLPADLPALVEVPRDVDGDDVVDGLAIVPGTGEDPGWLVVTFGGPQLGGLVWAKPLSHDADSTAIPDLAVDCDVVVRAQVSPQAP